MPHFDRLGLKENPFNDNRDPRYFYADSTRAQILESLAYQINFSSNIQVVIGEKGIGKSHLMETLSQQIDNNWRIGIIRDAGQLEPEQLILSILEAFDAPAPDGSDTVELLETQLAEIAEIGFKPVLLIDSAHLLPQESLRFLLQLSQQKLNDEPYINMDLFAETAITEYFQTSGLKGFREFIHI